MALLCHSFLREYYFISIIFQNFWSEDSKTWELYMSTRIKVRLQASSDTNMVRGIKHLCCHFPQTFFQTLRGVEFESSTSKKLFEDIDAVLLSV